MSDELFHKIIREGKAAGAKKFYPFLNGEPFMFAKIFEWLAYMDSQDVVVHIYTNASLLDKQKADLLVQFKCVNYVYCSFNGATRQTYEKVMGLDYDRTKQNIEYLRSKAPFRVRVGMVLTSDTIAEQDAFKKLWGRRAKMPKFSNWAGSKHDAAEYTNEKIPCRQVRTHMTVLWDGRVCLCCFDYDGRVIVGDLNKQSVQEVWNKNRALRKRHYAYDFDMPLCSDCNFNIAGLRSK